MVRAKFKVSSVEYFSEPGPEAPRKVRLWAVYDTGTEENRRFAKATPSGQIEMTIDNPPAAAVFAHGKEFYVDFTEVR